MESSGAISQNWYKWNDFVLIRMFHYPYICWTPLSLSVSSRAGNIFLLALLFHVSKGGKTNEESCYSAHDSVQERQTGYCVMEPFRKMTIPL